MVVRVIGTGIEISLPSSNSVLVSFAHFAFNALEKGIDLYSSIYGLNSSAEYAL